MVQLYHKVKGNAKRINEIAESLSNLSYNKLCDLGIGEIEEEEIKEMSIEKLEDLYQKAFGEDTK